MISTCLWYKFGKATFYANEVVDLGDGSYNVSGWGIIHGVWDDAFVITLFQTDEVVDVTNVEIIEILRNEAEKKGLVHGVKCNTFENTELLNGGTISYDTHGYIECVGGFIEDTGAYIMYKGKWAEPIKEEPSLRKEDFYNTKIWIGDNPELLKKVVSVYRKLGLDVRCPSDNKTVCIIYSRYGECHKHTRITFDSNEYREVYPSDLGIEDKNYNLLTGDDVETTVREKTIDDIIRDNDKITIDASSLKRTAGYLNTVPNTIKPYNNTEMSYVTSDMAGRNYRVTIDGGDVITFSDPFQNTGLKHDKPVVLKKKKSKSKIITVKTK